MCTGSPVALGLGVGLGVGVALLDWVGGAIEVLAGVLVGLVVAVRAVQPVTTETRTAAAPTTAITRRMGEALLSDAFFVSDISVNPAQDGY
jgi:hypothetical protein